MALRSDSLVNLGYTVNLLGEQFPLYLKHQAFLPIKTEIKPGKLMQAFATEKEVSSIM